MKPIAVAVLLVACGSIAWGSVVHGQEADNIDMLIQGLQHQAPGVRKRAQVELTKNVKAADPLLNKIRSGRLPEVLPVAYVLSTKGDLGATAGDKLAEIIRDPATESWRWDVAVQLLRKVAPGQLEAVLPELIAALSRDALRIHSSLMALQDLGAKATNAQLPLLHLMERPHDPLSGVLINALCVETQSVASTQPQWLYDDLLILETLKKVGATDEMLLPRLTRLANYEHRSVRLHAALQLSRLGKDGQLIAEKTLIQLLNDDHEGIREETLKGLRRLKTTSSEAVAALIPMLSRPEASVRRAAVFVLTDMGPAAKDALPALERATGFQNLIDPNSGDAQLYDAAVKSVQGK